ncbi:glutathione binding-like protein [Hyalangium versicolor]|uniref:glutathione binding-like protein n=1 Tax=Hyalangium versicolor TaxID=2861190 RepID=UPI001CCECCAC|nr:glutathione binding-like protein [Hyalangium versicolor]
MQLYFSPLSCSLATRICLYEANAEATYTEVGPKTKLTRDGQNYREVYSLGLVPAVRTEDGELLTENAAILQYVARRYPEANLAPADERGLTRLQQWLCFVGTELHKALFAPLLDPKAPEGAKAYALEKGQSRLAFLEKHLTGREFLLDRFSVADAYLFTVLHWSMAAPVDLKQWPALASYFSRLRERPTIAKALKEEKVLYAEELAKHKAA